MVGLFFSGWRLPLTILALLLLVLGFVLPVEHHGGWWEEIPGFWALLGFFGVLALAILARLLAVAFMQKPGEWWDEDE